MLLVRLLTLALVLTFSGTALAAERTGCTGFVGCGDGTVVAPEICDDGNNLPGDGCRPDCTEEGCFETCDARFDLDNEQCTAALTAANAACVGARLDCVAGCAGDAGCELDCTDDETTCLLQAASTAQTCATDASARQTSCTQICQCLEGCIGGETAGCNIERELRDDVCNALRQNCNIDCQILPPAERPACQADCTATHTLCLDESQTRFERCLERIPDRCDARCSP